MPLSALFILFDQAVHNPLLPQTNTYLALLDIGTGHFSRLDYASQGTVPSSLLAEFAHIARQYIRDLQMKEFGRDRHPMIQTAQRRESQDRSSFGNEGFNHPRALGVSTLEPNSETSVAALQSSIGDGFIGSQPDLIPTSSANPTTTFTMQHYTHQEPNRQPSSDQTEKNGVGNSSLMASQFDTSAPAPAMETISGAIGSEEFQLLGIDVMDLFDTMNFSGATADIS